MPVITRVILPHQARTEVANVCGVCVTLQKFAENNFIFLFIFPSIDNYLSGLKSPPLHQLYWNKSHFFSPQLRSRQSVSNNGRGDEILFILNHWKYNPTLEMPWPGRVNWKVLFEKFLATTNKGRPANTSFKLFTQVSNSMEENKSVTVNLNWNCLNFQ